MAPWEWETHVYLDSSETYRLARLPHKNQTPAPYLLPEGCSQPLQTCKPGVMDDLTQNATTPRQTVSGCFSIEKHNSNEYCLSISNQPSVTTDRLTSRAFSPVGNFLKRALYVKPRLLQMVRFVHWTAEQKVPAYYTGKVDPICKARWTTTQLLCRVMAADSWIQTRSECI